MISKIDPFTIYYHADGSVAIYSQAALGTYTIVEPGSKQYRWLEFRNIIAAAENCPALDSILRQAEITYELVKDASTKNF